MHQVHNAVLVVHNGRLPLCTASTMLYWWCTMVVHHRAPGTQCYISGARWHVGGASDVPPKSDFEVHSRATTSRTLSIRRPQSRPKKKRLDDMALLDKAIDALAKMLSRSEDPEETTLPDWCVWEAECFGMRLPNIVGV